MSAPTPLLDEKIVRIAKALEAADVAYAFGGAIALAYYGTPRGTSNIDLNVFLAPAEAKPALDALKALGVTATAGDEQVHGRWEHTPIDIFLAYDVFHFSCAERTRRVPFADTEISILSPEDLIVFKVIHGRAKDQRDVREMLLCASASLDLEYTQHFLDRFLAPDDQRRLRFQAAVEERGL